MQLLLLTAAATHMGSATSRGATPGQRLGQSPRQAFELPPPATHPSPLPALELLAHRVITADIAAPLQSVLVHDGATRPETHALDAILLDGTADPRAARSAALALASRTRIPRIALLRDASLAALSPEWGVAEFILPNASPAEVDARLRLVAAQVEQSRSGPEVGAAIAESGVEIDESNFVAKVHGRTLDLTYKEFELLHFLALHPARVFTREQLLSEVWGTDYYGGTRTVDVHVRRLRAKLGEHEWLISTVRGVGYGFARGRQE